MLLCARITSLSFKYSHQELLVDICRRQDRSSGSIKLKEDGREKLKEYEKEKEDMTQSLPIKSQLQTKPRIKTQIDAQTGLERKRKLKLKLKERKLQRQKISILKKKKKKSRKSSKKNVTDKLLRSSYSTSTSLAGKEVANWAVSTKDLSQLSFSRRKSSKVIVTMLKRRSQPAGNFVLFHTLLQRQRRAEDILDERTSETLRNKSIKNISIHSPIHLRPTNDNDFGYYLAGLIDGDGHFSKKESPQLVIVFNEKDASLAYWIKGKLGYGNVYKVKNKQAVILVVAKREGLIKVIKLINGKTRSQSKCDQINKNVLSSTSKEWSLAVKDFSFHLNTNSNLNDYWLAGFSDADASFQIKLVNQKDKGKIEVRLNFQIDQKQSELLLVIKRFFGGYIGYRKSQDTYYYGSTSFGSAKKVIEYFDRFHLLSSKHVNFLKWRKAYVLILNREHLTDSGLKKITNIKKTMNSYDTTPVSVDTDLNSTDLNPSDPYDTSVPSDLSDT